MAVLTAVCAAALAVSVLVAPVAAADAPANDGDWAGTCGLIVSAFVGLAFAARTRRRG